MSTLEQTIHHFHDLPISQVSSNAPYAVGEDKREAAHRAWARDEFLAGDSQWPEINLPKLNATELLIAERQLQALLKEIEAQPDDTRSDVVYEEVATKLAEVYRHLEVVRGLGLTAARQELSRERAGNMTLEIFGEPNKQIFNELRAREAGVIATAVEQFPELAALAAEYYERAGKIEYQSGSTHLELTNETINTLRSDIFELFPSAQELTDQDLPESTTAADAVPYFSQILEKLGLTAKGWRSEPSEGRAVGTDAGTKRVRVGKYRDPFTPVRLRAVAFHEGMHAYRAQRASEQGDSIRRRPLPQNLAFEEGLATALEQVVTGETRAAGQAYYVSLGYQLGLDQPSRKRRTFRETHELLWRRKLLLDGKVPDETTMQKAKEDAYQTTIRTMRGNSLDARDISYFEGGRKAVQWLSDIATLDHDERLRKLSWVLSGKFDPTNAAHAALFSEQ